MEAEYDQMAEEYDSTRDAPTTQEVAAIGRQLEGCRTLLDVGIGTGRFALPVSALGFEVTGADVSRRMLLKARQKGLSQLVMGDAYVLPFREKTFDAAIIIHVLHVVADWRRVMGEIGRVTSGKVISILRVPQVLPATVPRTQVTRNESGYPVRTQHRMWQNELELKESFPPAHLERIRDEVVTISIADAFRRLDAKRPFGRQMVPPEIKTAMMERVMEAAGSQTVERKIVEDLAVWNADQFAAIR